MYAEAELIERLRLICGGEHLLTAPAELAAYRAPLAVVLPGSASELTAVVTACLRAGVAYRPRGAATTTGAAGVEDDDAAGARPPAPVVVALGRLRRIIRFDAAAATVTAEPGVPLAALRRAVGPGRSVLPELNSSPAVTIGGALAGGAGRAALTALELLLPDASVIQLSRFAPGYDLCGAFVGSAGASGIAVRLELRVVPEPRVG